jgi:hypothetical protein
MGLIAWTLIAAGGVIFVLVVAVMIGSLIAKAEVGDD